MLAVPAFVLVLLLAFVFPPSEFTGSLLAARQAAYSDLLRLFIVLAALIFAAGFARPFLQYLREGEFEPKRMSSVLVSAFASAAALWLLVLMGLIIFFSVMPSYSGIAFSMMFTPSFAINIHLQLSCLAFYPLIRKSGSSGHIKSGRKSFPVV